MDRQTELLTRAEGLTRALGFDGFSFADLSQAVGIRKASVHYHFPTKASLARAMITGYRQVFGDSLQGLGDLPHAAGQLRGYLALYRAALKDGQSLCLCVAMSATRDSFDEQVLSELAAFQTDSLIWLRECFERAADDGSVRHLGDPASEAQAAFALVEGAQLMARAAADVSQFDAATAAFSNRLLTRD